MLLQAIALFALTILLFLLIFAFALAKRQTNYKQLPPGSSGWLPLIGETISFINPHPSSSRGQFLEDNIKRHGKIFRSHLFGYPTVVSCDAEFNHFILQNEDRLFEAGYPKNIPGVLGDLTLLVVTGDAHKRLRGVALNFFSSLRSTQSSSAFLSDIEGSVLKVMESWKNKHNLVFCDETRKFTFSVIVKQILSLSPEEPETTLILENFKMFMRGLVSIPVNLPGTPYAKAIQAKLAIREIVRKISERRKRGDQVKTKPGRVDFLGLLQSHGGLSEDEVFSLVIDLLIGGYETTAVLIAIIAKLLASNQDMLNELREEHAAAMRSKVGDEPLGWVDYQEMQFTQCLINEALRIGNVVKFVHRKAIKPIRYKGYEIPAGWKVLPILTAVHLDPSLHNDPFHFNPRRWQKVDIGSTKSFMPFGGGKRLCPGSELARLETCIFLHHLVLEYSWKLLEDDDCSMSFPYTDFKNGLRIAIKPLGNPNEPHQCNSAMTN